MNATSIVIVAHPTSAAHKLVKVTTPRGNVYACSWAEPFPSADEALAAWREDRGRRNFRPYNEASGVYVGA